MPDVLKASLLQRIRVFVGFVSIVLIMSYVDPNYFGQIIPLFGVSYLFIITLSVSVYYLMFSLQLFGAFVLLPFELAYTYLKKKYFSGD